MALFLDIIKRGNSCIKFLALWGESRGFRGFKLSKILQIFFYKYASYLNNYNINNFFKTPPRKFFFCIYPCLMMTYIFYFFVVSIILSNEVSYYLRIFLSKPNCIHFGRVRIFYYFLDLFSGRRAMPVIMGCEVFVNITFFKVFLLKKK